MLLSSQDREFLRRVQGLNGYLLLMAAAVGVYLLLAPKVETIMLAIVLCGVFWLTQRLLLFITTLDRELKRLTEALVSSAGVHAIHYSLRGEKALFQQSLGLNATDRRFLGALDRLKWYLLVVAASVLCYLLFIHETTLQEAEITMLSKTLCGVFWLTQRLLSFINTLNEELIRLDRVVKKPLS